MKPAEYKRGLRIHTHSISNSKEQWIESVWIRAIRTHNILSPSIKDADRKRVILTSALRVWSGKRPAINTTSLSVFLFKDKDLH